MERKLGKWLLGILFVFIVIEPVVNALYPIGETAVSQLRDVNDYILILVTLVFSVLRATAFLGLIALFVRLVVRGKYEWLIVTALVVGAAGGALGLSLKDALVLLVPSGGRLILENNIRPDVMDLLVRTTYLFVASVGWYLVLRNPAGSSRFTRHH